MSYREQNRAGHTLTIPVKVEEEFKFSRRRGGAGQPRAIRTMNHHVAVGEFRNLNE